MDIRQLRYFVAVADELHFHRAAERLHLAQPALSASIKQLEQSLGIRLLERNTRNVALTPEGHIFLERAVAALDAFDTAKMVGEQLRQGDYGMVSVGGSSQTRLRLSGILSRFMREFPHMETSLREQGTSQILDAVAAGDLDVGIGVASEVRENIAYRTLAHDELLLVVPTGHPLSGERQVPISVLDRETLLLPSNRRAKGSNQAVLGICAEAGVNPLVRIGDADHDEGFERVRAGHGVQLRLSDCIADKNHSAVSVLHLSPRQTLPVEVFWRDDRATPRVDRFVEVALSYSGADLGFSDQEDATVIAA